MSSGSDIDVALAHMEKEVRRAIDRVMRNIAEALREENNRGKLVGQILEEVHDVYTADVISATNALGRAIKAAGGVFFSRKLYGGAWQVALIAGKSALVVTCVFGVPRWATTAASVSYIASWIPYVGTVPGYLTPIFWAAVPASLGVAAYVAKGTVMDIINLVAPTSTPLKNAIGSAAGFVSGTTGTVRDAFASVLHLVLAAQQKGAPPLSDAIPSQAEQDQWLAIERALESRAKKYADTILLAIGAAAGASLVVATGIYGLSLLKYMFGLGDAIGLLRSNCTALVRYGVELPPLSTTDTIEGLLRASTAEQARAIFAGTYALYFHIGKMVDNAAIPVLDAGAQVMLAPETYENLKKVINAVQVIREIPSATSKYLSEIPSPYSVQRWIGLGQTLGYLTGALMENALLLPSPV